jgi:FkbM family methyltransferase
MPVDRLRKAYWFARVVLRDPAPYFRRAFVEAPKALLLRTMRSTVDLDGVKVRLGPHCTLPIAIEIVGNRYELPERMLLMQALEDDDVVLELGTGIGVVSAICARRLGSERVSTFEANPGLIPLCRETFRLNGVAPKLENSMLGNTEGFEQFYLERDFWSSSTVRRSPDATPVKVPMKLLSSALREIRPSFLIVDIEGGEAEIFKSVNLPGVTKVLVELHPHVIGDDAVARIRVAFRDAGYAPAQEMANGTQVYYRRQGANDPARRFAKGPVA